jgi:hypothetical protein
MGHAAIEPEVHAQMNAIAEVLSDALPKGWGFTLLMFRLDVHDGRMNYISSADREPMLAAMKELIANFEGRKLDTPKGIQ